MMRVAAATTLFAAGLALLVPPVVLAQEHRERPPASDAAFDPEAIVSLDRIQRQLKVTQSRENGAPLNLRYYVEVYGTTPPIDLFENFDVTTGPVPNAPPTHQEFLEYVTPREFRSPVIPISSILQQLFEKLNKR